LDFQAGQLHSAKVVADTCQAELLKKEAERAEAVSNLNILREKYKNLVLMPSHFFSLLMLWLNK
jgi:hypothetical protein